MRELAALAIVVVTLVGWMVPATSPPVYQRADDRLGEWFDCRWHDCQPVYFRGETW